MNSEYCPGCAGDIKDEELGIWLWAGNEYCSQKCAQDAAGGKKPVITLELGPGKQC